MGRVLPSKLPERGLSKDIQRKVNELIEYVRTVQPIAGSGQRLERTPNGTVVKGGAGPQTVVESGGYPFY